MELQKIMIEDMDLGNGMHIMHGGNFSVPFEVFEEIFFPETTSEMEGL